MPTPRVAVIDAYSLLYRAFFALPPLTNKQGEVTNAVYGFTTMLFKLLDEEQPDYLVVAIDMPVATFRHEAFGQYKAQRAPMPEALRPQVQMMKDVLEAMHIPLIGVPGFEADDVIGTLARRGEEDGLDVLIVTADRDALQLVDEHVHVLANKRGISETILYDPPAVLERYGVTPLQVPDVKALTGDTSDNIPGVPGIGEKTAGKLIAEYGSLENLLDHAERGNGENRRRVARACRASPAIEASGHHPSRCPAGGFLLGVLPPSSLGSTTIAGAVPRAGLSQSAESPDGRRSLPPRRRNRRSPCGLPGWWSPSRSCSNVVCTHPGTRRMYRGAGGRRRGSAARYPGRTALSAAPELLVYLPLQGAPAGTGEPVCR